MRSTRRTICSLGALSALGLGFPCVAHAAAGKAELVEILKTIDERKSNSGDYRAEVYIEEKAKGKIAVAYSATQRSASTPFGLSAD